MLSNLFALSCKDSSTGTDDQDTDPPPPVPVITSVEPDSGKFGEQVVIEGSNFGAQPGDNTVTFNGAEAVVTNASETLLITEVPKGAGDGPVEVSVGGQTGTGPDFDYLLTVTVSTYAGTGKQGYADGDAASAQFSFPYAVALGPDGDVFVADYGNHKIRKISPEGQVTTFAGSTAGYADGAGANAQFRTPTGLVVSASGVVYVADYGNDRIRKITSAGAVTTLAGDSVAGLVDGVGTDARFENPHNLDVDSGGNVYVAEVGNHSIRKISSAAEVTTLAGDGTPGYVDGDGDSARFNYPYDVAVDDDTGDLFVSDGLNDRVRLITPEGVVSTFAFSGTQGYMDGPIDQAESAHPSGIVMDERGNLYIADYGNRNVRMISGGEVTTLAGDGTKGYVDGDGAEARFDYIFSLTVDADGSVLYVADIFNDVIRKITLE